MDAGGRTFDAEQARAFLIERGTSSLMDTDPEHTFETNPFEAMLQAALTKAKLKAGLAQPTLFRLF